MSKDPRSFLTGPLPVNTDCFPHIAVHLRLLRPLCHPSHLPSTLLLAPPGWTEKKDFTKMCCAESGHCLGALPERALPGRQQDAGDQLGVSLGGEEGVDQRGTDLSAKANV